MSLLIAIPAAGASSRMQGRDKLLEMIDGEPILRRQARAAIATGADVLVTLPPGDNDRNASLSGLKLETSTVEDAATGMSASLRAATQAAKGYDALAILLPDVPDMTAKDLQTVIDAFDGTGPVRATDPDGRPGTPVILPRRLFPALARLSGDDGGRFALHGENVGLVSFPDRRATRDLDTPEDWAAWRHGTEQRS